MRFAGLSVLKRCPAVVFLMKYRRTLLVFLILTLSYLALLLCRVLCIQHAQVNPIFHSDSPVIDINNGSLYMLQALLERSSFNFVMYYTHWCAQSKKLVYEFHRASKKFKGQVSFIAINCWTGSCRQNGFFHSYPQLFFHHTSYNPLKYMGKHKTGYLTRFVKKAMYPFTYIPNNDILQKFIEQGKPSLLAFFNGTNHQDKKYNIFFGAALYSINKATSLQFGVITCFKVAAAVSLKQFSQLVLLNAFELPQLYPSSLNFTYVSIFQWAEQHKVEYVKELDPNLIKSNDFGAMMMKNGASLIMFVCKDGNRSDLLHLYHQVALNYHNCSCKPRDGSENLADAFPATGTRHASLQAGARHKACGVRLKNAHVASCQSLPPSSGNRYGVRNVCDVCRECYEMCSCDVTSFPLRASTSTLSILRNLSSLRNGCSSLRKNYPDSNVLSVCCFQNAIPRFREMILSGGFAGSGPKRGENLRALADDFGILNEGIEEVVSRNDPGILRRIFGNLMTLFSSSVAEGDKKFLDGFSNGGKNSNSRNVSQVPEYQEYGTCERRGKVRVFDGAGCYSNLTVNFYVMDSRKYWSYALALGVKHDNLQVALVIVDVQNEAQYVLTEDTELTNTTIVDFVMKFTWGNLSRRLRSAPVPFQPCLKGGCIIEVVSSTFARLVLDTHKDVLLMYYTSWCGFCKSVKPLYLALADHYRHSAHVRIARINADVNDLPWEYTVDSYPTFIFFPAKRKDLSVTFPDDEDRTLDSFVRFVEKHQRGQEDVTWQEDITWREDVTWKEDVTWLDYVKILRLEQEKKALRKQNDILRWRLRQEIERRREAEKKRLAAEGQLGELWAEKKDELRKRAFENAHIFDMVPGVKEQLRAQKMLRKTLEKSIVELQTKNHELKRIVHVLETENFSLSKKPRDRTENPKQ